MKHHIPLKRFEYFIAEPRANNTARAIRDKHSVEMHFRFMNVDVDFEKRSLSFEGEGIKVKTTIYPGGGVNLSDSANDELVFSLDGILEDGKTINSCSGLLVLHSAAEREGRRDKEWCLTIYLYDDYNDEREIKFNLTMWSVPENPELN
jgi:hypothetical protein